MAPPSQDELSHPEYWDRRYSKNNAGADIYDWPPNFPSIQPFLTKHLLPAAASPRILHAWKAITRRRSCLQSVIKQALPADLHALSYGDQASVDFSEPVIARMQAQHPQMTWLAMDVRSMAFRAASFDVAIDKATLDGMLHGSPWDPPDEARDNVKKYAEEIQRVLKPGEKWLWITWRQPHFVRPLILSVSWEWTIEVESIGDGAGSFEYFGFVMTKSLHGCDREKG